MVVRAWMGLTLTLVAVRQGTQDPTVNIASIHVIQYPVSTVQHALMSTEHMTVTVPSVSQDLAAR